MYNAKYFLYAGTDSREIDELGKVLCSIDHTKKIIAVPDGFELIDFLQHVGRGESYPLLIILNLEMKRLDGRATLELLKSDDIYRLIPTFMLLTQENLEARRFCFSLGTDVIIKPINPTEWTTAVRQLCLRTE